MALTAKPISTISYNTREHLKRKLDELFESGRIEDYRFIHHYGEDGDKDHFHVCIFPNRRIDTYQLREFFNEADPDNGDKPLGCMPFRSSSPDNWLMYAIHDPKYLKTHKSDNDGDGKIEYQIDDIVTPFEDQLRRDFKKALRLRDTDNQKIVDKFNEGIKLIDIAVEEDINPQRIQAMMNLAAMQSTMDDLKRINDAREKEALAIKRSVDALGSVTTEEEIGALKSEKRLGLRKVIQKEYTLDMITGEYVETGSKIITKGDEEDER